MEKLIYVYENWTQDIPQLLGRLYVDNVRGREIYLFEYDSSYLKQNIIPMLDPDIGIFPGRQRREIGLFGVFSDSCPDRWGRFLMQKRERLLAEKENRAHRKLLESDFLLGVHDESRMGALRFSIEKNGPFLEQGRDLAAPPWTTLRDLQEAARRTENNDTQELSKWLNMLVAPGSSLGGARPKVTVKAPDGSLWIAKFPSKYDEFDIGAWEMTVHDLAKKCGLDVPEAKLEKYSDYGSTFLVKRFDRKGEKRIHFSSAMTMLGKSDNEHDSSYLDLADFLHTNSINPQKNLRELWMRIAFNVMVSNTDDHLRNHGFILTGKGWQLSPLYDVNPNPDGDSLSLMIDDQNRDKSLVLVMSTAEFYGLNRKEVEKILMDMSEIVASGWRTAAKYYGIKENEIKEMKYSFAQAEQYVNALHKKKVPVKINFTSQSKGKGKER